MTEAQEHRYREFTTFMCKHVVALCGTYQCAKSNGEWDTERGFCASGFVLTKNGSSYLGISEHVVQDQDQVIGALRRGLIRVNRWGLADFFGPSPIVNQPIPFAYDDQAVVTARTLGLDLDMALVPLGVLDQASLAANGIVAIGEENWASADGLDYEAFAMLGFPEELGRKTPEEENDPDHVHVPMQPCMIGIERMAAMPANLPLPPPHSLIGRVQVPFSLKGMSGGPVFGFRKDKNGQWRYHIVAMQSKRYPTSQVIVGAMVTPFMKAFRAGTYGTDQITGTGIAV